jgi:hypothetical protein
MTLPPVPLNSEAWTIVHHHEITAVFIHLPYLLTFGGDLDCADIWHLDSSGKLEYALTLSDYVPIPELDESVIIDPEQQVVIIPSMNSSFIDIFSLVDGTFLNCVTVQGHFSPWPPRYMHGQMLLARKEVEEASLSHEGGRVNNFITSCHWMQSQETIALHHVGPPNDLLDRSDPSLVPLLLTVTGDIIGAYCGMYSKTMEIMRWEGPNYVPGQEPEVVVAQPLCFPDADLRSPLSTARMGEAKFALCTYERILDTTISGRTGQIIIYALDAKSLATHWQAEPLWGTTCDVHFSPLIGAVIAIGDNYEQFAGDMRWHKVTWIALLDQSTGACLRKEVIEHEDIGVSVVRCTISHSTQNPSLVIAFEDADHIIIGLQQFAHTGLPRHADDGSLVVNRAVQDQVKVIRAVVGDGVLVMILDDGNERGGAGSRMLGVSF